MNLELVKIKNIATVRNGYAFESDAFQANGIPIIRISDFNEEGIHDNSNSVRVEENFKYEKFGIVKEDILIALSGATVGKISKYLSEEKAYQNQRVGLFRLSQESVFSKYFYQAIRAIKSKIVEKAYGGAQPNISTKDIEELEIPLPSYENQIRIANLLEKIETTLAERKNAINLLDELVKATFYQMFGDPVKNEKGWRLLDGFEYANDIQVGVVIKPASYYVNEGVIALRSLNIKPNRIDLDDVVYFSEVTNKTTLSKSVLKTNDIVLVRTGNTGVAAIIPEKLDGANCIDLIICRPKRELVNSHYLVYLYNSDRFKKVVENNEVGGVHKHLNVGVLKNINLPIPPIALQNQFADIAQKIEGIKAEQETQLKDLEELYTSVSYQVFEREIDLSKVPFDSSLLPNPVEVTKEELTETPDVILQQEVPKEEIKKVIKSTKDKLTWESISFKEVADYIKYEFDVHYFNAEMLLRFLREDIGIFVNYFSSAEQKKNPQYENADDFYRFIATALTGENHFLTLEQVFYNAETENISNISFTETDLENLSKKDKKERSGIYFHIKE